MLKGPNAALFGRGDPGGTVNIVPKRADFDTRGRINLLAGSFDLQRGDADINVAVGEIVAVRLISFYEDAGIRQGRQRRSAY